MINSVERDQIIGAIYTAQNQYILVKEGHVTYEKARETILKWMNFGKPDGEYHDMMKYFNKEVSGYGPVMSDAKLRMQSEKEAWEALEYFDLIPPPIKEK